MSRRIVSISGRRLILTNLEKDLYPSHGFNKAHVIEYYRQIALFMLPHLKDRALTLKRYPEGVEKDFFFEKRCPAHPPWVKTAEMPADRGRPMKVCLVNDIETLLWVANLASLELHVPLSRVNSPERPDSVVFDLDPGKPAVLRDCAKVALILRDLLSEMRLSCYAKTSGMKGMHLYLPLNRKEATFEQTKRFSKAVAEIMQKNYPELVTARMAKEYRRGRVFINWSQNDPKKTMVCVYSLRAREIPAVSFPLTWNEVEGLAEQGKTEMSVVMPSEAVAIAGIKGDLFREVLTMKQRLPYT